MPFSISISTLPDTNPLGDIAKEVVKKTTFTKGTGLFVLIGICLLLFLLGYSKIPFIQESVSLEKSDIRAAFWTVFIFIIVFTGLYLLPEIIKRFIDLKK